MPPGLGKQLPDRLLPKVPETPFNLIVDRKIALVKRALSGEVIHL